MSRESQKWETSNRNCFKFLSVLRFTINKGKMNKVSFFGSVQIIDSRNFRDENRCVQHNEKKNTKDMDQRVGDIKIKN